MTQPKKFKRGKHSYTKWGSSFKQVHTEGKKEKPLDEVDPRSGFPMDLVPSIEQGVYANFVVVHETRDEIVLDFCFVPPEGKKGSVRARIILPPLQAERTGRILRKRQKGRT